jgi:hypothetical protein
MHEAMYGQTRKRACTLNDYIDRVRLGGAKSNKRSFRSASVG